LDFGAQVTQVVQQYNQFRGALEAGQVFAMQSSHDQGSLRGLADSGCAVLVAVGDDAVPDALAVAGRFRQVVLVNQSGGVPETRPDNVSVVSVDLDAAYSVAGRSLTPLGPADNEGNSVHTVLVVDSSVPGEKRVADLLTAAMRPKPDAPGLRRVEVAGLNEPQVQQALAAELAPLPDHTLVVLISDVAASWAAQTVAEFDGSASVAGMGADLRVDYPELKGRIALSVGADLLSALTQVFDAVQTGDGVPDLRVSGAVYPGSYTVLEAQAD
jgi:hypothetical protein